MLSLGIIVCGWISALISSLMFVVSCFAYYLTYQTRAYNGIITVFDNKMTMCKCGKYCDEGYGLLCQQFCYNVHNAYDRNIVYQCSYLTIVAEYGNDRNCTLRSVGGNDYVNDGGYYYPELNMTWMQSRDSVVYNVGSSIQILERQPSGKCYYNEYYNLYNMMGHTMLIVSGVLLVVFISCIYYTRNWDKYDENMGFDNMNIDNIYDDTTDTTDIESIDEDDSEYSYTSTIDIDKDRKKETVLENNKMSDLGDLEEIIIH